MNSDCPWELQKGLWPPRSPSITRYGATSVEVARSCALRISFRRDERFPSKTNPSAIIGTAIHAAVEAASTDDYANLDSLKERYAFLENIFTRALDTEMGKASASFRNRKPADREEMAAHYRRALIAIAREPATVSHQKESATFTSTGGTLPSDWTLLREIQVRDYESGLVGRIDRIEKTPQGLVITDFKATGRSDVPVRHTNQIKLYAALWQQRYGTWPATGQLRYLLSNATHHILIDPEECLELLAYARSVPSLYADNPPAWKLASPGDTCMACGYRPWCEPFWIFRENQDASTGLISDLADDGISGTVQYSTQSGDEIRLRIRWANRFAMVIAPRQLFPHAERLREGDTLRILDANVTGQSTQPTIRLDQRSELFFLSGSSSLRQFQLPDG